MKKVHLPFCPYDASLIVLITQKVRKLLQSGLVSMYMRWESLKVEAGIWDVQIAPGFKLIRFRQTKNLNNKIEPILWVIFSK